MDMPIDLADKTIIPGLYVTATPIGNMGDMTFRAQAVLMAADVIACEDTRVSGKLLARFNIKTPTLSYHDHNEHKMLPLIMERLMAGQVVALVSDAGTPLISDPGYRLVKQARQAGIFVSSLPGASAVLAALASAGLPTDRFMFIGFLPARKNARKVALKDISDIRTTLVFYESPRRLSDSLQDILEMLGDRNAAVCRELTKLFEEVRSGKLSELVQYYAGAGRPKGEIVIIVAAAEQTEPPADILDQALTAALEQLSLKEAVASVTFTTGLRRKQVYRRALELSGKK